VTIHASDLALTDRGIVVMPSLSVEEAVTLAENEVIGKISYVVDSPMGRLWNALPVASLGLDRRAQPLAGARVGTAQR